jgi:hypothetical protein
MLMSHFVAVVLVPPSVPWSLTEEVVARMLVPFDETTQVPPYQQSCWCIGLKAQMESMGKVTSVHPFEPLLKTFRALPEEEQTEKRWKTICAPVQEAYEAELAQHPDKEQPNPHCDTCHGSGLYPSTANPQGKWDWCRIGGRWDGWIFGREHAEKCSDQQGGYNFAEAHQQLKNNARTVRDIPVDDPFYLPFAVLTPEGQWHEMGQMGYFGHAANEKPQAVWHQIVCELYAKYPDHVAVTVDCHT